MTFAAPLVLLGLLAVPVLIVAYSGQQRRRGRVAEAFAAPMLTPSVAPRRPRWRRHLPMIAFLVAVAVLIVAAARPQRTVALPLKIGAVMLANDVSSSMVATDVKPTRLAAAQKAAKQFVQELPSSIEVGSLEFASKPVVLQSPSSDHTLTLNALGQLHTRGGTAIGAAIETAIKQLQAVPKRNGKRPPGAILLLSDGASNAGISPATAARDAAAAHIPVYTIALGTDHGMITTKINGKTVTGPVPPDPAGLAVVSKLSGGKAFTAGDENKLGAVYKDLAVKFGQTKAVHEMTASFAGGALILLLLGSVLSLRWFGRLI
jgi:Ca-activated chloride channel family protein